MTEKQKAEEMYDYASKLHGPEKAKEESLKSATATYSLAPIETNGMKNKSYWEKVIEHLKKK